MKKIYVLFSILILTIHTQSQTFIASSKHTGATQNQNQRKIVRDPLDNIFVVFSDWVAPNNVIKGVMFDNSMGEWGDAFVITEGYNPSLAIGDILSWEIHLMCETLDSISKIKHLRSSDFLNWSAGKYISDTTLKARMPIADIDSAGILNIFWIQGNNDSTESVVYAAVSEDSLLSRKTVFTNTEINDIALANHLQYVENDLFFAIQYMQDSLLFFRSADEMESFDTIYAAIGRQPCITYNSIYDDNLSSILRLLYIDLDSYLMEVETDLQWNTEINQVPVGKIDYVCVDDIAPPIGYSFIFIQYGTLFHGFSYGIDWDWCSILETISGDYIAWPSVAYKHFNFEYVDFIWMEENGVDKEIYYMRDEKHIWTDINEDKEQGKGFSITGFPNPFSEIFTINIAVDEKRSIPIIEIYDSRSILIKRPKVEKINAFKYTAIWDGTNEEGSRVEGGMYIILCSAGDKRTARKVIYK